MIIWGLIGIPFCAAVAVFCVPYVIVRRFIFIAAAMVHLICSLLSGYSHAPVSWLGGWLCLDEIGKIFLILTSILFFMAAWYATGYLMREQDVRTKRHLTEDFFFTNAPESVFMGCLLLFLGTMTIVLMAHHFGILWVAMEATTLVSAPLICFHRHHGSLEATWKYLLICSVGIALALLGNLFLGIACAYAGKGHIPLVLGDLMQADLTLHTAWLKTAFIFFLVGYGTKMGLAPLHTWLPDAHSEAPSVVSALLSGALLNCAWIGIVRMYQVCGAHGLGEFVKEFFVIFGLLSMGFAAMFIFGQRDYKRMLAYSSVEHMGILSLGLGLGHGAVFGMLLHAVNHSLTKAMLFFLAGIILSMYQTKSIKDVKGIMRVSWLTGVLWIAGFFAIAGYPPFGLFVSEYTILKAAIDQGHYVVAAIYLCFLSIIFIGMAIIVVNMVQGMPEGDLSSLCLHRKIPAFQMVPCIVLCVCILLLGIWLPKGLYVVLEQASRGLLY